MEVNESSRVGSRVHALVRLRSSWVSRPGNSPEHGVSKSHNEEETADEADQTEVVGGTYRPRYGGKTLRRGIVRAVHGRANPVVRCHIGRRGDEKSDNYQNFGD